MGSELGSYDPGCSCSKCSLFLARKESLVPNGPGEVCRSDKCAECPQPNSVTYRNTLHSKIFAGRQEEPAGHSG